MPLETALFARLIDHAPLFPPAELPLPEALEDHRRAREGSHGWIVRRFVVPASVLGRLDGEALALSVVGDAELDRSRHSHRGRRGPAQRIGREDGR